MSVIYKGESTFSVGQFQFIQEWTSKIESLNLSFPQFAIMKTRENIDSYLEQLKAFGRPVNSLLELGVMAGGSCAFFNEICRPKLHISIDANANKLKQLVDLESYAQRQGRIYRHFPGIYQQNTDHILQLMAKAGNTDRFRLTIDWVVDDASHWYEPSKASFNGLFPYLPPDGVYAIEDWAWAHWGPWQGPQGHWADEKALTNLIFEISMAHASNPQLIKKIIFTPVTVYVIRGPAKVNPLGFDISKSYIARGKELTAI